MKNILHISHTDINHDNRILKEINSISKLPNSNVFGLGIKLNENTVEQKIEKENIEIITLNLFTKKLIFFPKTLRHPLIFLELFFRSIFCLVRTKPSIIHCHDTLVLPIGVFYKIFNRRTYLIYDAHELESKRNGQSKISSYFTLLIEKISWSKNDLLISVSDSIINWYNKNLGLKKSLLIMNAPLINENKIINKQKNYFRMKYQIPEKSKVFLYVGLFSKGRSIEKILNVFSKESIKSHVVFIGFGNLEKLIKEYESFNNNIHFHPPIRHDKLVSFIKYADFGLCLIENISLSDYFCLPNKLFEYTFAGIPIIGSNFPEIKRIIKKHNIGVTCSVRDENSIKSKIKELENHNYNFKFNNLSKLSWEQQEKKLNIIYKKIINR